MRLAILRPADRLDGSVRKAEAAGFEVVAASPLAVELDDSEDVDVLLTELRAGRVDCVVLTSSTAVDALSVLLERRGADAAQLLRPCTLVAIGPATAAAMRAAGLEPDMMPDEHTSDGLVALLSPGAAGTRMAVLRSDHGDPALVTGLEAAGAAVRELALYRLVPRPDGDDVVSLAKETLAGRVDAFAFTSALTAEAFVEAASRIAPRPKIVAALNARTVGAIGPPTRRALERLGVRVGVVPERATFDALLAALGHAMDENGARTDMK